MIMARRPVKMPKSLVEAPTERDEPMQEEKMFPPMPEARYTPAIYLKPTMFSSMLPNII